MTTRFRATAFFGSLVLAGLLTGSAADRRVQPDLNAANALFETAKFAEAGKLYRRVVDQNPRNGPATARLGEIALLSNQLGDAERWLEKALSIQPDNATRILLAEAYYRQDNFQKAAPLLRAAGQEAKAKKLESFKGQTPYEIQGRAASASLKWVMTDPLPVVRVRVNGGQEVNFFLDTGASEVALDPDFARELGAPQFGSEEGTFAGGKKATTYHGRIDSLTLGDLVVRNLPFLTIGTRVLTEAFGGKRIDGIIGTVLLYHFITTMDYPRGELILRRKSRETLRSLEEAGAGRSAVVPMWMADDHFMVAWGRIDQRVPAFLFVDSGVAGGGGKLTESIIKKAGIKLLEDQATEGRGAGGTVRSVPFIMRELALGAAKEENVRGLFEGAFPWEHRFGFKLDGMVGHEFFRPYALTFDFAGMRLMLDRGR